MVKLFEESKSQQNARLYYVQGKEKENQIIKLFIKHKLEFYIVRVGYEDTGSEKKDFWVKITGVQENLGDHVVYPFEVITDYTKLNSKFDPTTKRLNFRASGHGIIVNVYNINGELDDYYKFETKEPSGGMTPKTHFKYKGKRYKIQIGTRGGKYICVNPKYPKSKIYLQKFSIV